MRGQLIGMMVVGLGWLAGVVSAAPPDAIALGCLAEETTDTCMVRLCRDEPLPTRRCTDIGAIVRREHLARPEVTPKAPPPPPPNLRVVPQ